MLTKSSAEQKLFFYLNHPIQWIRLVGVIVALDIFPTRWIMILDDSSGATIEITCGRPKQKGPILPAGDLDAYAKTSVLPDAPTEGTTATGRSIDLTRIDIGVVVKVKGGIGSFRGEKQVLLEKISVIHTTNEEVSSWAETTAFHTDILDNPWVVSERDEKRARRKAEGLDRERKTRDYRKRSKLQAHVNPKRAIAEKDERRREEKKLRRDEEKKGREEAKRKQEEDQRERQREKRKQEEARSRATAEQEKQRIEEEKRIAAEEQRVRDEEARRANTETERKERIKLRREQERRLREQEYEKLMRQRECI